MHPSQTNPSGYEPISTAVDDPPVVVVVGGVDPGGGAGLLRDVATAAALGARAHVVGTAWTEQRPGVHRVEPRAPAAVGEALAAAVAGRVAAVKIGMAVGPDTARAILEALADYRGPVVLDPVLASSRGGILWAASPHELLPLARRATIVTPNAPEAAALAGRPVTDLAEAEAAARWLVASGGLAAVLVKGGHLAGPEDEVAGGAVTDTLATPGEVIRFARARRPGPTPRGTGCALATVLAIELGRGHTLPHAIERAGDWLGEAIAAAHSVGPELHL